MGDRKTRELFLLKKESDEGSKLQRCSKTGFGLLVVIFAIYFLLKWGSLLLLSDEFLAFLTWCRKNPQLGAFFYSLFFCISAVLCLPEIALAAVSGFLFPYYLAFLATWFGGVFGACLAFFAGRYVLRGCTSQILKNKSEFLEELNNVIVSSGWKGVLLVRLPYIPFVIVNYGLSTTSISFSDYVWPTVLGLAPGSALFTYIGMSIKSVKGVIDGSESLGTIPLVLSIAGFIFFTIVFLYVGYLARKSMKSRSASKANLDKPSEDDPSQPLVSGPVIFDNY